MPAPITEPNLTKRNRTEPNRIDISNKQETDIELGFPADFIIDYWKKKEDSKFTKKMARSTEPPSTYPPVSD